MPFYISNMQVSPTQDLAKFSQRFTYMLPMVLQIFLPCYFGNEVYLASRNLSMSIFHSNWLHGSKKYRNALKIFITNAKKPIVIVSAKIFVLTLGSFVSICQITYKFYALLQSMNYWAFFLSSLLVYQFDVGMKMSSEKSFDVSLSLSRFVSIKICITWTTALTVCLLFLLEKSQSRAHCINQQQGVEWPENLELIFFCKEENTQ